jgi:hypothetical protein
VTVLVTMSGDLHSPFYAAYIISVALSAYHFRLVVGVVQGLVASVLWLCVCYSSVGSEPWLTSSFQLMAPIAMGLLAGVLRQGMTTRAKRATVETDLRRARADLLAQHLLAVGACAPGSQRLRSGPTLARSLQEAWEAVGVAAAAVFVRAEGGDLVLAAVHAVPELGSEIGHLRVEAGSLTQRGAGTWSEQGPVPGFEQLRETASALSSGERICAVREDEEGPNLVVIGVQRRGAMANGGRSGLEELLAALETPNLTPTVDTAGDRW